MYRKILFYSAIFGVFCLAFLMSDTSFAQCAMCKGTTQSNLKAGGTDGSGLNAGIMYMFLAPYIIVGTIGYSWWRRQKQVETQDQNSEIENLLNDANQDIS